MKRLILVRLAKAQPYYGMGVYKALGLIIMLWALHNYFSSTFVALDGAATASLNTIEAVATKSSERVERIEVK